MDLPPPKMDEVGQDTLPPKLGQNRAFPAHATVTQKLQKSVKTSK